MQILSRFGTLEQHRDVRESGKNITHFFTWFVRPNLFRFDWQTQQPFSSEFRRYSICSDGDHIFVRHPEKPIKEAADLIEELKNHRGISRETCLYIPSLLMKPEISDIKKANFSALEELIFQNEPCWQLKAAPAENESLNVTVYQSRPLIKRIVDIHVLDISSTPEPMLTKVKSDLLASGNDLDELMRPFNYISTYQYDQVLIDQAIPRNIFSFS